MSMSEMLKGVHAAVDAHEKAFNESRSWEAMIDAEHQERLSQASELFKKLDDQLDQVDITLVKLSRCLNPEDRKQVRKIRQHIFDLYAETEELIERI